MRHLTTLAMAGVAAIGLAATPALAAEQEGEFTSHHEVPQEEYEPYAEQLPADEKLELREYLDYTQREPCQFYQPIPQGFVRDGCHLKRVEQEQETVAVIEPAAQPKTLAEYELHFEFDSANIEPSAGNTIDRIANEIQQFNPNEVTVQGHADKAGPSDYNIGLSKERALAVSQALTSHGVQNRVLDPKAYGESKPAVQTPDGVPLRENRRVVVEFLK